MRENRGRSTEQYQKLKTPRKLRLAHLTHGQRIGPHDRDCTSNLVVDPSCPVMGIRVYCRRIVDGLAVLRDRPRATHQAQKTDRARS